MLSLVIDKQTVQQRHFPYLTFSHSSHKNCSILTCGPNSLALIFSWQVRPYVSSSHTVLPSCLLFYMYGCTKHVLFFTLYY